jgi:hypothetical protein
MVRRRRQFLRTNRNIDHSRMDAEKLTILADGLFESAGTPINATPPRYKVLGDIPPGDSVWREALAKAQETLHLPVLKDFQEPAAKCLYYGKDVILIR